MAAIDLLATCQPTFTREPEHVEVVTPDNTNELTWISRYLRVGTTAGAIAVLTAGGETVTIPNVLVGEKIYGRFRKVLATGTTAVGITNHA